MDQYGSPDVMDMMSLVGGIKKNKAYDAQQQYMKEDSERAAAQESRTAETYNKKTEYDNQLKAAYEQGNKFIAEGNTDITKFQYNGDPRAQAEAVSKIAGIIQNSEAGKQMVMQNAKTKADQLTGTFLRDASLFGILNADGPMTDAELSHMAKVYAPLPDGNDIISHDTKNQTVTFKNEETGYEWTQPVTRDYFREAVETHFDVNNGFAPTPKTIGMIMHSNKYKVDSRMKSMSNMEQLTDRDGNSIIKLPNFLMKDGTVKDVFVDPDTLTQGYMQNGEIPQSAYISPGEVVKRGAMSLDDQKDKATIDHTKANTKAINEGRGIPKAKDIPINLNDEWPKGDFSGALETESRSKFATLYSSQAGNRETQLALKRLLPDFQETIKRIESDESIPDKNGKPGDRIQLTPKIKAEMVDIAYANLMIGAGLAKKEDASEQPKQPEEVKPTQNTQPTKAQGIPKQPPKSPNAAIKELGQSQAYVGRSLLNANQALGDGIWRGIKAGGRLLKDPEAFMLEGLGK